jgi:nitrite reductase/ring-hydroxylating ferredoxin subunit
MASAGLGRLPASRAAVWETPRPRKADMGHVEKFNQTAARLLDHVAAGTTHQAASIYRFPASTYSDPVQFGLELEHVFRRVPLLLGFTAELRRPGDFKTIDIAEVPILLTRDRDGRVRSFLNACRHRGTPLTEEPCGNAARFVCPYHGWAYGSDGSLVGIADKRKFGDLDQQSNGLVELPCEERAGIVFGMISPGAEMDLDAYYGELLPELAHYRFETWSLFSRRELKGANWKIAFDGYMENYHFPTAHSGTLAPMTTCNLTVFSAYGPNMRMGVASDTVEQMRDMPADERWTRESQNFRVLNLLFPNVSFSTFMDVAQIAQILPGPTVRESRTVLTHLVRAMPSDPDELQRLEQTRDFQVEVLQREDYGLGLRTQRGVSSPIELTLCFGRNEIGNQYFHKWIGHLTGNGEPEPVLGE